MGRAGGGSRGGGGRSGGGSFSRSSMGGTRNSSRSFSRSSSGSRQSSNSFGRTSHGGSSFGGNSFGGGYSGGFGGFRGSPYGGASQRPRPVFINPGYGRKTVIINNGGKQTYTGKTANGTGMYTSSSSTSNTTTYTTNTTQNTTQQTYTAPKELTPEQKMARAERLAKEATDAKKNSVKMLAIGAILLVLSIILMLGAKKDEFQKYNLKGTVDVGYATDEGFTFSGGRTWDACEAFYEATGIPLYFYTEGEYDGDVSTCDTFTASLYDILFKDENHVLVALFDNSEWDYPHWSWQYGANASKYMGNSEINDLIDEIEYYWTDMSLSNDAVLAKGIASYQEKLTSSKGGSGGFAALLAIAGGVLLIVAVCQYIGKGKEAKKYEEEAETIQAQIILSKPLETFGNQEVDDLKSKYDNM